MQRSSPTAKLSGGRWATRAVIGSLLLVGCGGPDQSGPGGIGGPGVELVGQVRITSGSYTYNGLSHSRSSAVASFLSIVSQEDSCTRSSVGACTLRKCSVAWERQVEPVSAGEITIGHGQHGLVLTPDENGSYAMRSDGRSALWEEGSVIPIAATGDLVPGFQQSLVFPASVTVSQPVLTPGVPTLVSRSADLQLTWSGDTRGAVDVTLVGPGAVGASATITCSFPGEAGEGTVPAVLLGSLPQGVGNLGIGVSSTSHVTAGDWSIILSASSFALAPDGTMVIGQVLLQ